MIANNFQSVEPLSTKKAIERGYQLMMVDTTNEKSHSDYKSRVKKFITWLASIKLEDLPVTEFNSVYMQDFLDFLLIEQRVGKRTYMNYRSFFHTLFERLLIRGIIQINPTKRTERKKYRDATYKPLSDDEVTCIVEHIKTHDPDLLLAVELIYYCLFRPVELTRLKKRHFDLRKGIIRLPAFEIIKKGKDIDKIKAIPDALMPHLTEVLASMQPDQFLFSTKLKPGNTQTMPQRIQERFRAVMAQLGMERQLYRFKDTAIDRLLDNGVDIGSIQAQACHESPEQTLHYARRKNTGPLESIKQKFGSL